MLDLNIPVPIPMMTRATAKRPIIPLRANQAEDAMMSMCKAFDGCDQQVHLLGLNNTGNGTDDEHNVTDKNDQVGIYNRVIQYM